MGRIGRARSGYFHGGAYAPTGYDYIDGDLIVNEYEAAQVKELFERFAEGHTLHNCWLYMQSKYTTKYGGWNSETLIRNVLKNEVYLGKIKFKGQTYSGHHQPIISQELFDSVQNMFRNASRTGHSTRSPFKAKTLLSNLIYCGKCGARFHGEHGNYSCYSRTKGDRRYIIDPDCKNKKWKIEELDALVIQYITSLDFSALEDCSAKDAPAPDPDYNARITEIDRQIEKLIELYQIGSIPIETISERIQSLSREKNFLTEAMQAPKPEVLTAQDLRNARDRFLHLLSSGDLQEKRYCLTILIEKIVVDDDNVNIVIRKI